MVEPSQSCNGLNLMASGATLRMDMWIRLYGTLTLINPQRPPTPFYPYLFKPGGFKSRLHFLP